MVLWNDATGLTRAYERFLTEGSTGAEVRGPILSSWERSRALGVVPNQLEIPYQEVLGREVLGQEVLGQEVLGQEVLGQERRLLDAAGPVLDRLASALGGSRTAVTLRY